MLILHRKEGDYNNAVNWYNRAGKPIHDLSLDQEREEQVRFSLPEGK